MIAALLALASVPLLDVSFIAECGVLVPGASCTLFRAENEELYAIADTGGFSIGDRVYVVGVRANQATCEPGVDAVLEADSILPAPCPVEQFCACHRIAPCGNTGAAPATETWHGCGNSFDPDGASLTIDAGASGFRSLTAGTTSLAVRGLVPGQPLVLFVGARRVARSAFGDGLLCIGRAGFGPVRYPVTVASGAGTVSIPAFLDYSLSNLPATVPLEAGNTLYFQGWYRDPVGPCGTGSNATSALKLTLLP